MKLTLPTKWEMGQHMTLVGDTGSGKTFLAATLLTTRPYFIAIKTKADKTKLPGTLIRTAREIDDTRINQFLLQPEYDKQTQEILATFERVWREGSWTVYIDELLYLHRLSKALRGYVDRLLTQGRSKDITVVVGMQRPVEISRFAISQSTHVISFRLEGRDTKTLIEATTPRIKGEIEKLEQYHFLWFNRSTRRIFRGQLQDMLEKGENDPTLASVN